MILSQAIAERRTKTGMALTLSATRWLTRCVLSLLLLSVSSLACAHRGHGSWTEMDWVNDRFEITHQIHLADAIRLLEAMEVEAPIDSMEALALLALYVEARFSMHNDGGTPVVLETLGAEIDDDFLYVFQEWVTPLPATMPTITSEVLLDIEPSAQAFIHVEAPGITETFQLEPGSSSDSPMTQSPILQVASL